MIAGVCGGLGRAMRVDPVIFRITLAVLALFGGVGLLLYAAAWLLIPDDGTEESDGARLLHGHANAATAVAIVIGLAGILLVFDLIGAGISGGVPVILVVGGVAAIVAARRPGGLLNRRDGAQPLRTSDRLLMAPVIIVGGVIGLIVFIAVLHAAIRVGNRSWLGYGYGYHTPVRVLFDLLLVGVIALGVLSAAVVGRRQLRSTPITSFFRSTSTPTTTGFSATGLTEPRTTTEPLGPPAGFSPSRPVYPPWTPPPSRVKTPKPAKPPREPSFLAPLTLFLGMVAVGVLLALGASSRVDITAQDLFAAALLVVGLGLLVSTWIGRGRSLIVTGVLLTIGLVVSATINVPLRGGIGSRHDSPATLADLQHTYHLGIGEQVLDLRNIDLAGARDQVDVSVGIGKVDVDVPDDVKVVVRSYAGAGRTVVFGTVQGGTDVDHTTTAVSLLPTSAGEIDLTLRVGAGGVTVYRDQPPVNLTGGQP
jgi:phage shock protein PspC (stress-responsive transcriptional regulator)/predicted membrane protein